MLTSVNDVSLRLKPCQIFVKQAGKLRTSVACILLEPHFYSACSLAKHPLALRSACFGKCLRHTEKRDAPFCHKHLEWSAVIDAGIVAFLQSFLGRM